MRALKFKIVMKPVPDRFDEISVMTVGAQVADKMHQGMDALGIQHCPSAAREGAQEARLDPVTNCPIAHVEEVCCDLHSDRPVRVQCFACHIVEPLSLLLAQVVSAGNVLDLVDTFEQPANLISLGSYSHETHPQTAQY
jgi:hypothetical protein